MEIQTTRPVTMMDVLDNLRWRLYELTSDLSTAKSCASEIESLANAMDSATRSSMGGMR